MNKEQILRNYLSPSAIKDLEEAKMMLDNIYEAMEEYRNQPPKSAGVKTAEHIASFIPVHSFDEQAQPLYTGEEVRKALTAQAKDHQEEMEAFYLDTYENLKKSFAKLVENNPGRKASELIIKAKDPKEVIQEFRNQKPRG